MVLALNGNFTVVDTSKPLISVGKLISQGHVDSERGSHHVGGWEDEDYHPSSERCVEDARVFRDRRSRKSSWIAVGRGRWSASKTFEGARQADRRDDCYA